MECKGRPKWRDAPLTKKAPYKPDALIGHVRFDERGWETERCRMAQATAPILDSTFSDLAQCLTGVRNALQSGHRREQHSELFKEVTLNRGRPISSASEPSWAPRCAPRDPQGPAPLPR